MLFLQLPWSIAMQKLTHLALDQELITDDMVTILFGSAETVQDSSEMEKENILQQTYPLRSLRFKSCWLTDKSLKLIGEKCPDLESVHMFFDKDRHQRLYQSASTQEETSKLTLKGLRALTSRGLRDAHLFPLYLGKDAQEAIISASENLRSVTISANHKQELCWDAIDSIIQHHSESSLSRLESLTIVGFELAKPTSSSRYARQLSYHWSHNTTSQNAEARLGNGPVSADRVLSEPHIFSICRHIPSLRRLTIRHMDFQLRNGATGTYTSYVSVASSRWEVDEFVMRFRQNYPQMELQILE
jgi:hypothetical protein